MRFPCRACAARQFLHRGMQKLHLCTLRREHLARVDEHPAMVPKLLRQRPMNRRTSRPPLGGIATVIKPNRNRSRQAATAVPEEK